MGSVSRASKSEFLHLPSFLQRKWGEMGKPGLCSVEAHEPGEALLEGQEVWRERERPAAGRSPT